MAILIDPPRWPAHDTLWSHVISDASYDELHRFATRLSLPRRAFDLDHYDVPASLYERAIELGAKPVESRDVVFLLQQSGLRVRQIDQDAVRPVRRRQYLLAEWASLGASALGAGSFGAASALGKGSKLTTENWLRTGDELISRWNEPHRAYHDERHLEDVLLALNHLTVRGERVATETLLAAWFHDAVYTARESSGTENSGPQSSDEVDSARLASATLGQLGIDAGLSQRVGDLITATAPAMHLSAAPPPLAHLLDADLSIFAASRDRYSEYTAAVRVEYAHIPHDTFREGRGRILSTYLDQPHIYRTPAAHRMWEERARENVGRELQLLRAP